MKTFTSAEFLILLLAENLEKSEYYRKVTPKGVRTSFFYVTDSTNADINADDNGTKTLKRETREIYVQLQWGKCLLFIEIMLSIITISE